MLRQIICKWRAPHNGPFKRNDKHSIMAVNALKRVIIMENPHMVFLSETELVKQKLKFQGALMVSCEGEGRRRRGGLALLWYGFLDVTIQSFSQNHIDAVVECLSSGGWRFTSIYGHPEDDQKHKTGTLLKYLKESNNFLWVCGGDFNLMLTSEEKKGGCGFDNS